MQDDMPFAFTPEHKDGVYEAIYKRRDMRHFKTDPVDPEIMEKLLHAGNAAPSVGLMQPWRFIRITDVALREGLHKVVDAERMNTAEALGERRDEFMKLKVEGVRECGELLVVTLMDRREEHIFGRRTLPQMDLASVSCAIQNIWLAARAEGLGVGWVSLFDPDEVKSLLGMPDDSLPIAILCIGHVEEFYDEPMLEQLGWRQRGKLEDMVMENGWDAEKAERSHQRDK
jgi:5,6-dimethylbenzimidazole synthase